jgi:extracellular elastinolytic metalloproteinase
VEEDTSTPRLTVSAGQRRELLLDMPRYLTSSASDAAATGDGVNLGALIDDTEATNWASLGSPIAGKPVTVRLARAETFDRIQVSAMLRHRTPADVNDSGGQNRFSALRRFELLACEAGGAVDCTEDAQFRTVYTSAADAFPAVRPRPRAPNLIIRSFAVPSTRATHVRLRVLTNHCMGTPGFRGDQDDDPRNVTDCVEGSTQDDNVRAAELQLFR